MRRSHRENPKKMERFLRYSVVCFAAAFLLWITGMILRTGGIITILQCIFFLAGLLWIFLHGFFNQDPFLEEDWETGENEMGELGELLKKARERLEKKEE